MNNMKKLIRKHKDGDTITLTEKDGLFYTDAGEIWLKNNGALNTQIITPNVQTNSQQELQQTLGFLPGLVFGSMYEGILNLQLSPKVSNVAGWAGMLGGPLMGLAAAGIGNAIYKHRQNKLSQLDTDYTQYNQNGYTGRSGWFGRSKNGERRSFFLNGGFGRSHRNKLQSLTLPNSLTNPNVPQVQLNLGSANIGKSDSGMPTLQGFNYNPPTKPQNMIVNGTYTDPLMLQTLQPLVEEVGPIRLNVSPLPMSIDNPTPLPEEKKPLIDNFYPIPQAKSGIKIKKKNKGKFTDYCGGKVTDACIKKAKASGNKKLIKRATFAENAKKWKHQLGGQIKDPRMWAIINNNMSRYKNISITLAIGQAPIFINGKAYYLNGDGILTPSDLINQKKKYKSGGIIKNQFGGLFAEYKPIINTNNNTLISTLPNIQLIKYPNLEVEILKSPESTKNIQSNKMSNLINLVSKLSFMEMIEKYGGGAIKVGNTHLRPANAGYGVKNSWHKQAHPTWKNEDGSPMPMAFDLTPNLGYTFKDLWKVLDKPEWRYWLASLDNGRGGKGWGIVDESTPAIRATHPWRATGDHIHLGAGTTAWKQYVDAMNKYNGSIIDIDPNKILNNI